MTLVLHAHPLSSYCWKVLIGLYELGAPFEARTVDLGDSAARAAFVAMWPTASSGCNTNCTNCKRSRWNLRSWPNSTPITAATRTPHR